MLGSALKKASRKNECMVETRAQKACGTGEQAWDSGPRVSFFLFLKIKIKSHARFCVYSCM